MFGFLKKKEAENTTKQALHAVATGKVIPIDQVSDQVFSQKMMGDGYAVIPENGEIFAPVAGKVVSIFPTKHAVGFKMANGLEILLHMGVDTVELKGTPFEILITEGDDVTADTAVAKVDLAALKEAGKDNAMIVVLTNMDATNAVFDLTGSGAVQAGETVGTVVTK